MAECRPLLRQRLGVGRGIDGGARIGRIFQQTRIEGVAGVAGVDEHMRRPLLVSTAPCSASQLITLL